MSSPLTDDLFKYPEEIPEMDVIKMIGNVLKQSPVLGPLASDGRYLLANYIHRACWQFGINPVWILVSFEREETLLSGKGERLQPGSQIPLWPYQAACGVVGQDGPGTSKPQFLGLLNQIFECAKNTAWSCGFGPNENFGYRQGLWPSWGRWNGKAIAKALLDGSEVQYLCNTMAEYSQLTFTPHVQVLQTNGRVYEEYILPFFKL